MASKTSPFLVSTGAALLLLSAVLYAAASHEVTPQISNEQYRTRSGDWLPFTDTLPASDTVEFLDLVFVLELGSPHARYFQVIADDCVERLSINGQEIGQGIIPFCDLTWGRILDLGTVLHAGNNAVTMTIQNVGGPASFTWRIAWWDPLLLGLRLLLLAGLIAGTALMARGLGLRRWQNTLLGIFSFGVILRLLYVFATSYTIRAYDADGHLEYIRYVAQHLALPPIRDGWEFYQAPLYYMLTGLWLYVAEMWGRTLPFLIRDTQWIAFFFSVATLGAFAWVATLLFVRKEKIERGLFLVSLAVLPSILFLSARINNDVLLLLWEALGLGLLIAWWQKGRWRTWWLAVLMIALSILTKTNGLLLVPVAFVLLAFKPRLSLKTKMFTGALSVLMLILLTGWIFTLREGATPGQPLVVNTGNLSSGLFVQNTVETFTELNPLRMILRPYNNPWDDAFGRQYFWEYLFKSAFFGEFDFGPDLRPLASAILVCGLLLLAYAVYGLWLCIRREALRTLPLWSTTGILLLGHALHRYITPHSCAQDFRFSLLVSVPVIYFAIRGVMFARAPFWRSTGMVVIASAILLQSLFLFGVIATL